MSYVVKINFTDGRRIDEIRLHSGYTTARKQKAQS